MPRSDAERDPESFAAALRTFEGHRYPLDGGASKVLRFMLERPEGCDADLTADRFEIRFGWHPARHRYYLRTAPPILSEVLALAGAVPGQRQVDATIGPATIHAAQLPAWSFASRLIWLEASSSSIAIQVRDASKGGAPSSERPAPIPPPIELLPRFLDFPSPFPCPYCSTTALKYRQLHDGPLVCGACGRSFRLSDT